MSRAEHDDETLPRAIAERLAARDRTVAMLTPDVDAAVARQARAQFAARAPRRHARTRYARWTLPAAAAATIVLALLVVPPLYETVTRPADDVDGSGRVDVLDAFALARQRAGDPSRVSRERIDELTARIVALEPREDRL